VREVAEVVRRFGKVVCKLHAIKGKFQTQRCPGWDRKMIEENRMRWLCNNTELLQVGEGHHPFGRSVTGVRD
jgi:hypothetical protein